MAALPLVFALTSIFPYAPNLVMQSQEAVHQACEDYIQSTEIILDRFVKLSLSGEADQAYALWSRQQFNYSSLCLELDRTRSFTPSPQVQLAVESELGILKTKVQKLWMNTEKLLPAFLHNAERADQLTPQQRKWTEEILRELGNPAPVPGEKASFALYKGIGKVREPDELKVLTANVICFPGVLPYFFGGISPWEERLDRLVDMIVDSDADVVCLQEIWDPMAMQALRERLEKHFAWFVEDAGDPAGTLKLDKMGYSSGLFIAGRLPLESTQFHRFDRSIPATSNRGFLMVEVTIQGRPCAIMTTHLQHGDDALMQEVRKEQLEACHDKLKQLSHWGCLVGDLNVDGFLPELQTSGLSTLFDLSGKLDTSTNYFSTLLVTPPGQREDLPVVYEWLDYGVTLKGAKEMVRGESQLIPLFDVKEPTRAVSDHQALLYTWKPL